VDEHTETRRALTDVFCRTQPKPAKGRLEFADLRCAGLSFRITSKDSRTFCFRFRDPLTRATTRATIGTYPDIGLALTGTVAVLAFVLIRAASFHHIDQFIGERILGLKWNWILEVGGISIVLLSSEWRRRSSLAPSSL
jgi:hypothetical protein